MAAFECIVRRGKTDVWQICRNNSIIFVDFFEKERIISNRMDTKNESLKEGCAMLRQLDRGRIVVGAKQLRKALESGRAACVFMARNADPAITGPIEAMCQRCNVEYVWVPTKQELGRACGIDVGAAAAAAIQETFLPASAVEYNPPEGENQRKEKLDAYF